MDRIIEYAGGIIKFELREPGVYSFGDEPAKGKSYLCQLLNLVQDNNIEIMTYNSSLNLLLFQLKEFKASKKSILIIDRFDLFICQEITDIIKSMPDKYILLDLKNDNGKLIKVGTAVLIRRKGEILVYA